MGREELLPTQCGAVQRIRLLYFSLIFLSVFQPINCNFSFPCFFPSFPKTLLGILHSPPVALLLFKCTSAFTPMCHPSSQSNAHTILQSGRCSRYKPQSLMPLPVYRRDTKALALAWKRIHKCFVH